METYLHGLLSECDDPIDKKYLTFIPDNLPPARAKKKTVLVIGAGMAGLVAAGMLKRDHEVWVAEANTRVGGRCKTFRNADGKKYWVNEELHAEAGAMRLPNFHYLLQRYIDVMKLEKERFYNASVSREAADKFAKYGEPDPPHTGKTFLFVNYLHLRLKEYLAEGANINNLLDYGLSANENRRAQDLLDDAVEPLREFIKADPQSNWPIIIEKFGEYSMRRFLKEETTLSENAIEMIGVLQNLESRMSADFIQSFIEMANINPTVTYWQIVGGTYKLPEALYAHYELENNTYFDCRVTDLYKRGKKIRVTVNFEKQRPAKFYEQAGFKVHDRTLDDIEFDEVIVTVPFSAFRQVHVWPKFSQEKRKAIRELHYDAATKVILEFKERWWEEEDYDIVGGGSITDLSNRFIYYPSQNIGKEGGGVILAVYCWADDARRWDSMSHEDRYKHALDNLAIVHAPNDTEEQDRIKELCLMGPAFRSEGYEDDIKGAATVSWMQNPYAFGEAAIFAPGQLRLLQQHIIKKEWGGTAHFAGEHTSLKHAWIEGAIESGIRAALEVNDTELRLG